jgi:hypothetical protein
VKEINGEEVEEKELDAFIQEADLMRSLKPHEVFFCFFSFSFFSITKTIFLSF